MKKYAKIINEETKEVSVGTGTDSAFYLSIGMTEMEVEQSYDGNWYLVGYTPQAPEPTYAEKRAMEYPSIQDQLDMLYWDKVNGANTWQEKIAEIKAKYPKEVVVSKTETVDIVD